MLSRLDLRGLTGPLDSVLPRPRRLPDGPVEEVRAIIEHVRTGGDQALIELTRRFDGVELEALTASDEEIATALERAPRPVREALEAAAAPEGAGHIAALEGAVYADDAARESWRVVQVLAQTMYEAEGAVLLLDRRQGAWRTIYDVPSGGTKTLSFPMQGMTVRGDRLFASVCIHCEDWGAYRSFEIDLRRNRATLLGWEPESDYADNPPIRDVRRGIFSE